MLVTLAPATSARPGRAVRIAVNKGVQNMGNRDKRKESKGKKPAPKDKKPAPGS